MSGTTLVLPGPASLQGPVIALRRALAASGAPVSLAFIDVAGVGAVNGCHGSHAGDRLLGAFEQRLRAFATGTEEVWRHGGDEYVLLMPDCSARSARRRVEALHRRMRRETAAVAPDLTVALRFRAGGATIAPRAGGARAVYDAAARALAEAKKREAAVVWARAPERQTGASGMSPQ